MTKARVTTKAKAVQAVVPKKSDSVIGEVILTPRQKAFVAEYLKDRNASQAAIRAGYSKEAAGQAGYSTLKKPHVRAAIDAANDELMEQAKRIAGLTLERLTLEVARGAFFDLRRLVHEDGSPKDLHELDEDTASAIAGIDIEELFAGKGEDRANIGRIRKYKLVDRRAYVDMGLKVIGGYKEDNKQQNAGEALAAMLKGMKSSAIPVVHEVGNDDA